MPGVGIGVGFTKIVQKFYLLDWAGYTTEH